MNDLLLRFLVAMVTGVASGIASWWFITRLLRPRLHLEPQLSYYYLGDEDVARSQARVRIGRRAVVELTVTISLRIPDLIAPRSIETFLIHRSQSPYVRAGSALRWRISVHQMPAESLARYRRWLEPWREAIVRHQPIDVKDFLAAHPRSKVVVTVTARDAYTGSPAAVQTRYGIEDFRDGPFPRTSKPATAAARPVREPRVFTLRWFGWAARWCADEFRYGWDASRSAVTEDSSR